MSNKTIVAVCLVLFVVSAQLSAEPKEQGNPCKSDTEKFCKDVKPGEGGIIACLKQHEAELSSECKARGLEVKQNINELKEACKGDAEKLCAGIEQGEGRLAKCLKQNEDKLSETCKGAIKEKREKLKKNSACAGDIDKLCKGVQEGEGRIIKCLKENEKDLSEVCKTSIARGKEKAKEKNPCFADTEKFCKDVTQGKGAIVACLKQHEAELSAGCKAKGLEVKKAAEGFQEACKTDLAAFCKDVKQGEGRLLLCLKENKASLSETCKAKLMEGREKMKEKSGKTGVREEGKKKSAAGN